MTSYQEEHQARRSDLPAPATISLPATGMNREQATVWLLAHCRSVSELQADQALDAAVIDTACDLGGHAITWDRSTGFTIHPARPAPDSLTLKYWTCLILLAGALTVYALQGLAGHHTIIPALALALTLATLTRATWEITLLARTRHGHPDTVQPRSASSSEGELTTMTDTTETLTRRAAAPGPPACSTARTIPPARDSSA